MVRMRRAAAALSALAIAVSTAAAAWAHAFLDHATPGVGSTVASAPATVALQFTQDIEPAFSSIAVTDQAGQRVDLGKVRVPPGKSSQLEVMLKPLAPGTYTVRWRVVSVDTHPTEGSFTFQVGGR